jgi:hypothetical protein
MSYEVATRNQFTFLVDDARLNLLLTAVVATTNTINVNIVGISVTADANENLFVKIIVGTDDPQRTDRGGGSTIATNDAQNAVFRGILCQLHINFSEQLIIQVFNLQAAAGTPGAYRILTAALFCNNIKLIGSYFGEPALTPDLSASEVQSTFFEVPYCQVAYAVQTLIRINPTAPFNEAQLCINRNNVSSCLINTTL